MISPGSQSCPSTPVEVVYVTRIEDGNRVAEVVDFVRSDGEAFIPKFASEMNQEFDNWCAVMHETRRCRYR